MKRLLFKRVIAPIFRCVSSVFFDPKYLRGRYFDESLVGWQWVLRSIVSQKMMGFNRNTPWPVSPFNCIAEPSNIYFDPDDINNFQTFGCYFSNTFGGKIFIGKGTYIAPNVGLITTNHDLYDPDFHLSPKDIHLGEKCWIGMNAIILPGVALGDHTVVGAGSVVTKSFPEGYCVIVGSPARIIKIITPENDRHE
jgi:hypothetical protein